MAICKCKMCGGDLNITELDKVVECEYCGTTQTVPSADNEKKMTLFNRANRLRSNNEFDKAAALFEQLVAEFPEEAEAYWGLCLCNYGIEYVDDPATGKKIPTCHRASFEKLSDDENFNLAMEYADVIAQRVYRREAQEIDRINEEILSISRSESPYDIFICYKETDENGGRTPDSVMAQDIYDTLTGKGYKVFFARISLEDKLGQQYEPYIFAALNSAKIMLSVGTKYEYFHAVWVKNEWSRFLRLAAKDKSKTLIPCYKDMDPYDMPDEFKGLQAQDLGKLGAMQDLVRGVEKLLPKDAPAQPAAPAQVVVANSAAATTESLLKRAFMFLEDGNWQSAGEYAEKALDIDPENGEAYLAKAMAEVKVHTRAALSDCAGFEKNTNTAKALRFGGDALKTEINGYIAAILEEEKRRKAEEAAELEQKKALLSNRRKQIALVQNCIAAGCSNTVGLRADGTVLAVGFNYYWQCNTGDWTDVAAIAVGEYHTVGLRADGTVLAVGDNECGQCNTGDWTDVIAIAAGGFHTVGLRADGTVLAVGYNKSGQCNTGDWTDVAAIAARGDQTVGLRADGTVLAVGDNRSGQCNTGDWTDVAAIAAGKYHTVGLRADGTVLAVGDNYFGQCNTGDWTDVAAIAVGDSHTVGLRADGTVLAVGDNRTGQCNVRPIPGITGDWTDVAAIAAGNCHTVGLRADGTVLAVGHNTNRECNTRGWKLFDHIETIEEERLAPAKRAEEERKYRVADLSKEKSALEAELPTLKGLFKAGRRKEVESRLAAIEAELKKLEG